MAISDNIYFSEGRSIIGSTTCNLLSYLNLVRDLEIDRFIWDRRKKKNNYYSVFFQDSHYLFASFLSRTS